MSTDNLSELPLVFEQKGFRYTQLKRSKRAAIYQQQWIKCPKGSIAFEVIRPNIEKRRFIDGRWQDCPPYECYPSSEQWGDTAWTLTTLDAAEKRYSDLQKGIPTGRETP